MLSLYLHIVIHGILERVIPTLLMSRNTYGVMHAVLIQAVDQMMRMYQMFIEKDCTAMEINPLATDSQNRCMHHFRLAYLACMLHTH